MKKEFILEIQNITNIDYAHFLAFHEGKCKRVHGHGSCTVSAEVGGYLDKDWVVDFGVIKKIVKGIVEEIDHKFVVPRKYAKVVNDKVVITYKTDQGDHYMELPKSEVFIFDKEPTLENIIYYIALESLYRLPQNVLWVKIIAQEGQGGTAKVTVTRSDLPKLGKMVDKLLEKIVKGKTSLKNQTVFTAKEI